MINSRTAESALRSSESLMPKPSLKINTAQLDRNGVLPLHAQIERLLRRMVHSDDFRRGQPFPGEVDLSKRLGVSRNTVRAAIAKLEVEGLLQRKRRVGTTVNTEAPHSSLLEWYSFTDEMRKQGITVENFSLSITLEIPTTEVIERLNLEDEAPVWKLERVRGWHEKPVVLAVSWLHPSLGIHGDEDFSKPLYSIVKHQAGVTPHLSRESICAVLPTTEEAKKLNSPPVAPLLLRTRTIYDRKHLPIEQNYNLYVTDHYHLTLELGNTRS